MALSNSIYNQTRRLLVSGDINFNALRVMLRDDNTGFNPNHTNVNNLSGLQVSGNGWPNGGATIPNVNIITEGSSAILTADDLVVNASNGTIGPASKAVIIDDQNRLLLFLNFIETKEAVPGTPFSFLWNNGEIIRWD